MIQKLMGALTVSFLAIFATTASVQASSADRHELTYTIKNYDCGDSSPELTLTLAPCGKVIHCRLSVGSDFEVSSSDCNSSFNSQAPFPEYGISFDDSRNLASYQGDTCVLVP